MTTSWYYGGIEYPVELDRPQLEEDRYVVLLVCGHWVHTRAPQAGEWPCPVTQPAEQNHGMQRATVATDGTPAILVGWDLWHGGEE